MTTLPLVSTGIGAPPLADAAQAPDAARADAHAAFPGAIGTQAAPSGPPGTAADLMARYGAEHDLHPLAQQQIVYAAPGGAGGMGAIKSQKGVPDADTRTWDVSKTSQADIDALKNSPDKQQQRLGHTIENAKASYGDLLAKGARIVVTMNEGNGKEPVMTLTAPGFDPKLPVRVHTHYHGDNATVGDPEGSKAGQNSRIRATLARDPQTVFILPECQNATPEVDGPKHDNGYPADWGNVKNQAQTTDRALEAAGISKSKIEQETVSVHSRGGSVISKLLHKDDGSGSKLRADRLELHDSLYGSQGDVAKWGRSENGRGAKVIYVHGSNPAGRDQEIAKTFGSNYIRIDISRQKPLDDKNNPVVYNGKDAQRNDHVAGHKGGGREGVRQYNPDPHYQTTGRFLAIWPLPNRGGT